MSVKPQSVLAFFSFSAVLSFFASIQQMGSKYFNVFCSPSHAFFAQSSSRTSLTRPTWASSTRSWRTTIPSFAPSWWRPVLPPTRMRKTTSKLDIFRRNITVLADAKIRSLLHSERRHSIYYIPNRFSRENFIWIITKNKSKPTHSMYVKINSMSHHHQPRNGVHLTQQQYQVTWTGHLY